MDEHSEAHLLGQSQHPDAVKRLFEIQDAAAVRGDSGLVAEVQSYLDRNGVTRDPVEPVSEPAPAVVEAVVPAEPERAVPAKPRRGRRG